VSVEVRPPPLAVIRLVNPIMRRVLRSRVGARMAPLAVLEFTGRRSGLRRSIPVGLHELDGGAAVFTDRPWRASFRGGADVELTRGGTTRRGTAELVDDPAVVGPALAAAVAHVGARKLGLAVTKGDRPTSVDFGAVGKSMIRIRFA
jgi:hypothetical protein